MNILFIGNCTSVYGANRSMIDLAAALKKEGCNTFFFFPSEGKKEEKYILINILKKNNFQYKFLNYSRSVHHKNEKKLLDWYQRNKMNQECLGKMADIVKRWKIDIIHTNSLTHTIGAKLAIKVKKPHVWHIRENLQSDYDFYYDNWLEYRYLLKRTGCIICISNNVRKTHSLILKGTNVQTLYNGFEIENYLLHDAYHKDTQKFQVIICGVIREEKGQLDAVKAIECLVNKYRVTNVHLNIVGGGNGKYYEDICSYIQRYKLEEYISLLPFQENLRELRREADIALVCSSNEAFGRVTIESMLSENLVIGADAAGTSEIIRNKRTGYLYKPGDERDLCKKLYYVIKNWGEQERIIENAQKYAVKNYDNVMYAQRILKIYRTLVV